MRIILLRREGYLCALQHSHAIPCFNNTRIYDVYPPRKPLFPLASQLQFSCQLSAPQLMAINPSARPPL